MPRNFSTILPGKDKLSRSELRRWLQIGAGALALLNAVALYLCLDPPGGSRRELIRQRAQLQDQIASSRGRTQRLKNVAAKVQLGSSQSSDFQTRFILPKRLAYGAVIAEIERMAKSSGLQERDANFTEEPIEGSADLSLLNSTANYEGTYENLKKFLYQVDHSPMLIMLENITAAPVQRGNTINTSIRFQAVIQDDAAPAARGPQ
jgi:Tfp pilus assembly protein PilO